MQGGSSRPLASSGLLGRAFYRSLRREIDKLSTKRLFSSTAFTPPRRFALSPRLDYGGPARLRLAPSWSPPPRSRLRPSTPRSEISSSSSKRKRKSPGLPRTSSRRIRPTRTAQKSSRPKTSPRTLNECARNDRNGSEPFLTPLVLFLPSFAALLPVFAVFAPFLRGNPGILGVNQAPLPSESLYSTIRMIMQQPR